MFTLVISTENDAFSPYPAPEISRLLQTVAGHLASDLDPADRRIGANTGKLLDLNGNTVGSWKWTDGDDPLIPMSQARAAVEREAALAQARRS